MATTEHLQAQQNNLSNTKIAGKFAIGQKLGSGSFGDIYLGKNFFFFPSLCLK
jgi:hypothetical protein